MSEHEAKTYVDLVVEGLVEMGIIPQDRYGRMTVNQTDELVERVKKASEE